MRSRLFLLLLAASLGGSTTASAQASLGPDDTLLPEQFTEILKQEWIFLKAQTDSFLAETTVKREFETTPEFEGRVALRRQVYMMTIARRIKEQKFDTKSYGVLLKAHLVSYNADKKVYALACSVAVEAPYDIPSLVSFVPTNKYVMIKDTIVGGYRTNRLLMKFRPTFSWKVERPEAMEAKGDEGNVYFKVRAAIDISQPNIKQQALLRIVPKEFLLVNTGKGKLYYREEIR